MNLSTSKSINKLLIKNGKIVNADFMQDADIYIEDGLIKYVGQHITVSNETKIIDATGCLILPGGIDPSFSSMGQETVDDFEISTKAAIIGGTTTIIHYVYDRDSSLISAFDKYKSLAEKKSLCDFSFNVVVGVITESTEKEMAILTKNKGVNGFKFFMTGEMKLTDRELLKMFECCKRLGAIAQIHAENDAIIQMHEEKLFKMGIIGPEGHLYSRPEDAESEAVFRCIILANQTRCPIYIAPVMSKSSADVIAEKRQQGYHVFGETTTAALGANSKKILDASSFSQAASFVTSPPIRCDAETPTHLMKLLSCDLLQLTGSVSLSQKSIGIENFTYTPKGVQGCEERMSIIWDRGVMTGIIDPCRFVAITSTNAAKIYNIYPRKGRVDVNSDADLVIWDPYGTREISSKTHPYVLEYNLFEGMEVRGIPQYVILRGSVVAEKRKIISSKRGLYIPTQPFATYVFGYLKEQELFPAPMNKIAKDEINCEELADEDHERWSDDTITKKQDVTQNTDEKVAKQNPSSHKEFYSRPPTRCGGRNQLDSSFNLTGAQLDDTKPIRTSIRILKPPGDISEGFQY